MINKKNFKQIYISSIIVILLAFISAIIFFFKNSDNKNYIAIIDIKLAKSIDHIFLDSSASDFITDYTARTFDIMIPQYVWGTNPGGLIEVKLFTSGKREFYLNELPELEKKLIKNIPALNKIILDAFTKSYNEGVDQDILVGKELFYWNMSRKPIFTGTIKTKVRFRKLQLTELEFISISIFISLSLITLVTAYYISRKKKN